jgi:glycosyltransferase involved in cell wall biosynthesis
MNIKSHDSFIWREISMSPHKLAIAARGLTREFSGPNTFILGLISGLLTYAPEISLHIYGDDPQIAAWFPHAITRTLPTSNRLIWDHLFLPVALKKDQIEIAIFPKGPFPFWAPPKPVSIFLDLGYFYPSINAYRTLDTLYMRFALQRAAQRAWKIFTISEFTRQDTIRILKANPKRIITIYGAPADIYAPVTDPARLEKVRQRYRLQEPFIFYPTSISPRKNVIRLLKAFEGLIKDIPHHLYFTGSLRWKSEETFKIINRLSERVHLLGAVPSQDMPALYTLAAFTVYPSLFEGFGLPVVEAFRCGSPVMTSKLTSLPEIAGEAALFIDAYDVQSIREGLIRMSQDAALREHLRQKGFERARLFTWEKTIRTLLENLNE